MTSSRKPRLTPAPAQNGSAADKAPLRAPRPRRRGLRRAAALGTAVAAVMLVACVDGQPAATVPSVPQPAVAEESAVPVVSVHEPPVWDAGPSVVGFFAYGEGGNEETAAVEGVRFAMAADPQAWWKALRDDAPDGMEALPPGYRVRSAAERLESAPAVFVTTGADGVARGQMEPGRDYLFCAMSPLVEGLVAGCTQELYDSGRGYGFHVYFSGGRAHFMAHDRDDGSSHYEQFQQRSAWSQDPIDATFVWRVHLDFADEQYPEGWYFHKSGVFVAVRDADIARWWRAVSQDDTSVISIRVDPASEIAQYVSAEWGSSNQLSPLRDIPSERLDSAPGTYVAIAADGAGTLTLAPGDYLICLVGIQRPTTVADCKYEDIAASHDVVIERVQFDDPGVATRIIEHSKHKSLRILEQLQQGRTGSTE